MREASGPVIPLLPRCPLCESDAAAAYRSLSLVNRGEVRVVRCQGEGPCGFWYAREAVGFDTVDAFFAAAYDAEYEADYLNPKVEARKAEIASDTRVPDAVRWAPEAAPGAARRWLDVGCSQGALLGAAQRVGFCPYGIEMAAATATRAREQVGAEVRVGLFESPELTADWESTMHVLSAIHVFEHTLDPRGFLARARALLVPGGVLLLEVPNARGSGPEARANWEDPRHVLHFTRQTLDKMVTDAGFDLAEQLGSTPRGVAAVGALVRRLARPVFGPLRWVYRRALRRRISAASGGDALVLVARKPVS